MDRCNLTKSLSNPLRPALAITLLLLTLASAILWYRSRTTADMLLWHAGQRDGYIKSVANTITVGWYYVPPPNVCDYYTRGSRFAYATYYSVERHPTWWQSEWFRTASGPTEQSTCPGERATTFAFPHWLLVLLPGVPALFATRAAHRDLRRRRRAARGLCARCGYDLRASADRCPECGAPPAHYD